MTKSEIEDGYFTNYSLSQKNSPIRHILSNKPSPNLMLGEGVAILSHVYDENSSA